ncbi:hypothetical protein E2B92_03205 [Streptomyces sp. WAC05374]|uniref:hypothetical protein n=1 Tax=Streptomyces sp. WAC05374 TaxID=2487420 RepID=UPI000F85E614|nr:hypothetical protein [Streptomyces sp. WAC05374]RST10313.1 hypothetical protein EF905_27635 [Streptomyces sp. WAC05374]TDF50509.1 hypothetical protein E2B92_03205 [Streptomyces sp. WAC05374]
MSRLRVQGRAAVLTGRSRRSASTASSTAWCGTPAPNRVAAAVSTQRATSRGVTAPTSDAAATRRLRSRVTARRCSETSSYSRPMTSRNIREENAAMTAAFRTEPSRASTSSMTGAMSDAPARTTSRRLASPGPGWGTRSVSRTMEGCRAARPQAVKKTTQPRSMKVPTRQVPWSWSSP